MFFLLSALFQHHGNGNAKTECAAEENGQDGHIGGCSFCCCRSFGGSFTGLDQNHGADRIQSYFPFGGGDHIGTGSLAVYADAPLTGGQGHGGGGATGIEDHNDAVFFIAGAGSGKTRVLVSRVAWLMAQKQVDMDADLKEIKADVKNINLKPAKRWDTIIDKALLAAVGALVAYIAVRLGLQ